ncbi:hypothetical protein [Sphingomonas melonis]|uniref:Uncharacterized protein n=1 Tax=Sphingomonas melonis TaxID=152682 RepID=A0A7Y9FKP8_9SPHN|nr:hypothetical protein [Sphingomonas melonis]NYD88797.1 hypothetical protein [Sphingomonas melonis]
MSRIMTQGVEMLPVEQPAWRCYHCGDVFTDDRCARLHFGRDEDSLPACQIKAGAEQGLLGALREAEYAAADAQQAIANECTDAAKAYYAQATRHAQALRNAEELGYERGLADARAEALNTHPAATGSVRVVPVKPTPEMVRAGAASHRFNVNHSACEIWSAMLAAAPTPDAAASEAGEVAALAAELRPLIDAAAGPNGWDWMFPLRVKPVDGKPTIVSHKGGNLFRGYIGTWQEAELLVALANAAPRILAALTTQGGAEG